MALVRIVIPTKNEEKYLSKLLDSIKNQTFKDYEIIVADAKSTDNTVKIARRYGCRIVKGGTPAIGRNNGAKGSKTDVLLFLDSDVVIIKNNFIETAYKIFKEEKLLAAGFYLKYPNTRNIIKNFYLGFSSLMQNLTFKTRQKKDKPAMQCVMMFDSKVFFDVKGFRDVYAEEGDILERIIKKNKKGKKIFRIIPETGKITSSERRFEKEGYFNYTLKVMKLAYRAYVKKEYVSSQEYFGKES